MPRALVTLLLVLAFFLPSTTTATAHPPSGDWQTTAPESQGLDSAKLADALLAMRQAVPHLHGFLLARDGQLVVDAAFYPYDGTTPHDLASVTKSVMTTLIGIAVDQGKLSLDDPVLEFFPDHTIANRDERKERMTVGDLAGMTSGLACVLSPGEPQLMEMLASDNWLQFSLDLPMSNEPGSTWDYCSPAMHILSAVLTASTGQSALDFAWLHLFGPLGIREVIWPTDQNGITRGWGDLHLYPRDLAKIGQLWLNGGSWNGQQLVSSGWVEASISPRSITTVDGAAYGYGWWLNTDGTAGPEPSARGRGGQYLVLFPALNALAVIIGSGDFGASDVLDVLTPALVDPTGAIPTNPDGEARLAETLLTLADGPDPATVVPLPDIALAVTGRTYGVDDNWLGLTWFRMDFDGSNEATFSFQLEGASGPTTVPVGLDGRFRLVPGDYGYPLGLRGTWRDEDTFRLEYDTIANNHAYLLDFTFSGELVTMSTGERINPGVETVSGAVIPD